MKKYLVSLFIVFFVATSAFAGVGDIVAKDKLSGSTNGKLIEITGTNTATANIVHTAVTGTTNFDEIWIWAFNAHTTTVKVYIEWGTHADSDDLIVKQIPPDSGLYLLIPGQILNNGMTVEIFAGTASKVFISGYVNHMTGG